MSDDPSDDPLAEIRQTYFQECDELLGDLERGLMAMEEGAQDSETVNLIFRAVHSIKGGAGAFGLDGLVRFAHAFEETLEELRSGHRQADPTFLKAMLVAADVLADLVREARGGAAVDGQRVSEVIDRLRQRGEVAVAVPAEVASPPPAPVQDDPFGLGFQPVMISFDFEAPAEPAEPAERAWTIVFRPLPSLYARAGEPAAILRELGTLGACTIALDDAAIPTLDEFETEDAYLGWTISLRTAQGREAIADVFAFVEGDCGLSIACDEPDAPDAPALAIVPMAVAALPELFEPEPELASVVVPFAATPTPAPAPVAAAPRAAAPSADESGAKAQASQSIRVELERIDKLVDIVGELVINQAMLAQRISECDLDRSSSVSKGLEELEHLTRDLQESVMAIRAQPVRSVFQRIPRLVREVASMCGKEARLVTEGEGTEVDKTVIERLSDPITHMVRNAIDHGLERPEGRIAAGKPVEGTVRLSAAHRSGRIIIEVSDDGAGINRERVRDIAVKNGVIGPDVQLSDEETDNLIFLPGFSTASKVSDISGRGVGMDVVRSSIQSLGGRISISSRPGLGSTFTLSLPLTLAVLDGMVVTVAGETLVVPLTAVVETLQPKIENVRKLGPSTTLIAMRDSYVPLLDVGQMLGYRAEPLLPTAGVLLLVETGSGQRSALLVDAIQGQRQVVIKSLEANYQAVQGIAAATILGDGRIALILDVDAVAVVGLNHPDPGTVDPVLRAAA